MEAFLGNDTPMEQHCKAGIEQLVCRGRAEGEARARGRCVRAAGHLVVVARIPCHFKLLLI